MFAVHTGIQGYSLFLKSRALLFQANLRKDSVNSIDVRFSNPKGTFWIISHAIAIIVYIGGVPTPALSVKLYGKNLKRMEKK